MLNEKKKIEPKKFLRLTSDEGHARAEINL